MSKNKEYFEAEKLTKNWLMQIELDIDVNIASQHRAKRKLNLLKKELPLLRCAAQQYREHIKKIKDSHSSK